MEGKWSTFLYRLVVLHGLCTAIQGVRFPIKINSIRYEGGKVASTSYVTLNSSEISISRSESQPGWLDVWNSSPRFTHRERIITFKAVDIYSLVGNILSIRCHLSISQRPLNVEISFTSKDEAKQFRYDEIPPNTLVSSSSEIGLRQSDYFEYELKTVLFDSGSIVERVMADVILENILIRNSRDKVVSQFHIRPRNDGERRSSNIIFTEGYFNVSRAELNRVVLSIWASKRNVCAICLVFTRDNDADEFTARISPLTRPDIEIQTASVMKLFRTHVIS